MTVVVSDTAEDSEIELGFLKDGISGKIAGALPDVTTVVDSDATDLIVAIDNAAFPVTGPVEFVLIVVTGTDC